MCVEEGSATTSSERTCGTQPNHAVHLDGRDSGHANAQRGGWADSGGLVSSQIHRSLRRALPMITRVSGDTNGLSAGRSGSPCSNCHTTIGPCPPRPSRSVPASHRPVELLNIAHCTLIFSPRCDVPGHSREAGRANANLRIDRYRREVSGSAAIGTAGLKSRRYGALVTSRPHPCSRRSSSVTATVFGNSSPLIES